MLNSLYAKCPYVSVFKAPLGVLQASTHNDGIERWCACHRNAVEQEPFLLAVAIAIQVCTMSCSAQPILPYYYKDACSECVHVNTIVIPI